MLWGANYLLNRATPFIAVLALVLSGTTYLRSNPSAERQTLTASQWEKLTRDGNRKGARTPRVTIVEFADFECPYCAMVGPVLDEILERHPGDIRVVFHHLPLSFHEYALRAAIAAECARRQQRFDQYRDSLFLNQATLGRLDYDSLAMKVGVGNLAAFRTCLAKSATEAEVTADQDLAQEFSIDATPTLFVNGVRYGGGDAVELRRLVDEALRNTAWWHFWGHGTSLKT